MRGTATLGDSRGHRVVTKRSLWVRVGKMQGPRSRASRVATETDRFIAHIERSAHLRRRDISTADGVVRAAAGQSSALGDFDGLLKRGGLYESARLPSLPSRSTVAAARFCSRRHRRRVPKRPAMRVRRLRAASAAGQSVATGGVELDSLGGGGGGRSCYVSTMFSMRRGSYCGRHAIRAVVSVCHPSPSLVARWVRIPHFLTAVPCHVAHPLSALVDRAEPHNHTSAVGCVRWNVSARLYVPVPRHISATVVLRSVPRAELSATRGEEFGR
jgi:hypothetical protein